MEKFVANAGSFFDSSKSDREVTCEHLKSNEGRIQKDLFSRKKIVFLKKFFFVQIIYSITPNYLIHVMSSFFDKKLFLN